MDDLAKQLLLIEDNPGDVRFIREMLRERSGQFDIEHCETLADGLRLMKAVRFDAILLDLNLPDSFGMNTVYRTVAVAHDTPVIVLTAIGDDEMGAQAIRAGAQDYLEKDQVNFTLLQRSMRYAEGRFVQQKRIHAIIENNVDPTVVRNKFGKILFMNMTAQRIFNNNENDRVEELLSQYEDANEMSFEILGQESRSFEIYRAELQWENDPSAQLVVLHDVTERNKVQQFLRDSNAALEAAVAERTAVIARTNRALRTLIACNQSLIHAEDEQRLLQDICTLVVKEGGYRFAWIGFADPHTSTAILPQAWQGVVQDVLQQSGAAWMASDQAAAMAAAAMNKAKPQILHDHEQAKDKESVRPAYVSQIILPLLRGDSAFGVLAIYSDNPETFDAEEIDLLNELADDLSFGIETLRMHAERRTAVASLQRFRAALDNSADAIFLFDPKTLGFVDANDTVLSLLGYAREELRSLNLLDILPDYDEARLKAELKTLKKGEQSSITIPTRHQTKFGASIRVEMKLAPIVSDGVHLIVAVSRDISERVAAEEAMRKLSTVVEQTPVGVMITDPQGTIEYVNKAYEDMTGYAMKDIVGKQPSILKSGFQDPAIFPQMWQAITHGEVFHDVFVNRKKDGSLYYEDKIISSLHDDDGAITHYISTGADITQKLYDEQRIQTLIHYDPVTELPNRTLFMERLEQALAHAHWRKKNLLVLTMDINNFGVVNESLGHANGDRVIKEVGARLAGVAGENDTVARLLGDEFGLILEGVDDKGEADVLIHNIVTKFNQPFVVSGQEFLLLVSIGAACYPDDGLDGPTLLKNAQAAMNRAKVTSQTSYQIYRPEFEQQNARRLSLSTDLRHALERGEFELFYQPKIILTRREIAGVEALIRWNHPRHGLISPVEFIPLLEESGSINEVGIWVIQQACRQQQLWLQNGLPMIKVAVNISARQFEDNNLANVVEAAVNNAGGDCSNLELELTESLLMSDLDHTVKILGQLSDMGLSLSIDDFGTGYSSLIYLTKLPVHTLKIDREFIRNIPNNAHEIEVARAIIALSHTLNLEVVAEGVETEEQLKFLQDHNCDYVQGYYYAKPLQAGEIAKLVSKWRFVSAGRA